MMFYRLALKKIIEFLDLDDLFKNEEPWKKKPKAIYKTVLLIDQKMNLYVSILLSLIGVLVCLSIPIAALKKPACVFIILDMPFWYSVAIWMTDYAVFIDLLIVLLCVLLTYVSLKTVLDAIRRTDISMSPWRERGKYFLPKRTNRIQATLPIEFNEAHWIEPFKRHR